MWSSILNKTVLFICGPTAIGKTAVAIKLAEHFSTDILSFDSRQFYKELEIGAAPPSPAELARAKHHFVGHLSLIEDDTLSAGGFEKKALERIDQVFKKQDILIAVGGSGLYMSALREGFDELPKVDQHTRQALKEQLQKEGLESLSAELQEKDPSYAEQADLNNPQRVVRALEIIHQTGKPFSVFRKGDKAKRSFNSVLIGLEMDRAKLYDRINQRVDLMITAGLEDEAKSLYPYRDKNALQTVGYKEWWSYFEGNTTKQQVIDEIKKNSRRYAKRQLTWFKNQETMPWFEPTQLDEILLHIKRVI